MVTWSNGLNVLCCLGDRGEREWRESRGTRLLSTLQHSSQYLSILFGILVSSPSTCGNVQRDRENPFCINQDGECERENKELPSGEKKKKKSLISETELPNEKYQVGRSCPINCSYYYLFQPYIPVIYGFFYFPCLNLNDCQQGIHV